MLDPGTQHNSKLDWTTMDHTPIQGAVNSFPTANKQGGGRSDRTPFLMLFGEDFLSGCRKSGMSPEQVGMYIYMLILEWTDKEPLDDDMRRLAVRCGWDVRIVKRLVSELVGLTKYQRENGKLSNERMEREIAVYCAKVKAKEQRKAAHTSRVDVTQLPDSSAVAIQQLADSYATAKPDLSEKPKENNEPWPKNLAYTRARNIQNQNHIEKEEVASPPATQDVLAALNGSAYPMLESIAAWMPSMGDTAARQWLSTTVRTYGEDRTKDAFVSLSTRIAEGQTITHPLRMWSKLAADPPRSAANPPARGKPQLDKETLKAQRDKIRAENGWVEEVAHG
jgi:uncharacterized protein YdaU (DUF1376 family)